MAYQKKDGDFSLFPGRKKGQTFEYNGKQIPCADMDGTIVINGVEHYLSAYAKTFEKDGKTVKFLSGRVGKPVQKKGSTANNSAPQTTTEPDDDCPF